MEPSNLHTALAYIGCKSLDEFARSYGLDAINLADPTERALVEQNLLTQSRRCQDWFENKLHLFVEPTPKRTKIG
jgi:hypothetical protein